MSARGGVGLHLAVLVLLAVLGAVLPAYHATNLARIMVLAVFAMGYNLAFGYTGLLSLGHALFFAAGLYAAGLLAQAGLARARHAARRASPPAARSPRSSASSRSAPPASPS